MGEHIEAKTAALIAKRAEILWRYYSGSTEGVVGSCASMFDPDWLGPDAGDRSDYGPADFFRFCSGYDRSRPGFNVQLKVVQTDEVKPGGPVNEHRLSRWAALETAHGTVLTVYAIEYKGVAGTGPNGFRVNQYLAWSWNLLHEVGHMMLHASRFVFENRLGPPFDRPVATEAEEEQAWFFASCVVGLALGQHAFNDRSHPRDERRPVPKMIGAPWELVTWTDRPARPAAGQSDS